METNLHDLIGVPVIYTSSSGREWNAVINGIPDDPYGPHDKLPIVSIKFINERGKLKRFERVPHQSTKYRDRTQSWRFKKD